MIPPAPAGSTGPVGLDLSRLTSWLDGSRPGLRAGPLSAELIEGGRSNLTYRLTDGASTWALRRPPLGHVLVTAHDMVREYTVISALGQSVVPVPAAIALCTDPDVLGQPFYLMSYVDGVIIQDAGQVDDVALARRSTQLLADTLAALHAVDPAEVGLADFGRPDGFRERQVRRWHKQFLASWPGEHPGEIAVADQLSATVPAHGPVGIVHGDYRLTNVMFSHDLSEIRAVVDWEMATIGDPLTDVGLLYVYHALATTSTAVMAGLLPERGFLSPSQLVERYAAASGTAVESLDWYVALGYFKLAVIAAGIHARYLENLTVGAGFDQFGPLVEVALDGARRTLGGR
jgi:aminoglycoside phosphotransferase (APT) family kinase protein